jgi:hypothetical protein
VTLLAALSVGMPSIPFGDAVAKAASNIRTTAFGAAYFLGVEGENR